MSPNTPAEAGGTEDARQGAPEDVPETTAGAVASATRVLDTWRARIDELKVQVDLAAMGVREQASAQIEAAQNAWLAAHAELRRAAEDASGNARVLREGVERLLADVKKAFEAAQSVLSRG